MLLLSSRITAAKRRSSGPLVYAPSIDGASLQTLTLMTEAGVLGRYLPEFGRIVAQMQFNMYHSYTVDEHTLRAVGIIAEIAQFRIALAGDDEQRTEGGRQ